MKYDIVLVGVGGQGILTTAILLDQAAQASGLQFKQSEVHGMSQRGGSVESHVRISDQPISSDIIPEGAADIILSTEPLESLRYLSYLKPDGLVITSTTFLKNMENYPDEDMLLYAIRQIPHSIMIDAGALASEAGSVRSQNLVMLGALLPHVPLDRTMVEQQIDILFASKPATVRAANLKAFQLGFDAAKANK